MILVNTEPLYKLNRFTCIRFGGEACFYMRFNNKSFDSANKTLYKRVFSFLKKDKKTIFRSKSGKEDLGFFTLLFLCGGDRKYFTSRETLTNLFKKNNKEIKFIISEDLASLRGNLDLLSFEKLLECISKMILIPIESMGTACELGAFTYLSEKNNKEVVILNLKFKNDHSFINDGPISILKSLKSNQPRVIYTNFEKTGEITTLTLNSDVSNLPKHNLFSKPTKYTKYFIKEGKKMIVKNLETFLILALDVMCLFKCCNAKSIIDFILFSQDAEEINVDFFENKDGLFVENLITTYLKIFSNLGFLTDKGEYFAVNSNNFVAEGSLDKWIGKVIFRSDFLEQPKFNKLKGIISKELKDFIYDNR